MSNESSKDQREAQDDSPTKVQENCIHIIPLEQLPDGVLSHIFSFLQPIR